MKKKGQRTKLFVRALLLFAFTPTIFAATASFQGLSYLPGGTTSSPYAISGDGRITVGASNGTSGRVFVWCDGSMDVLAALPWSYPYGVSSDGAVIVGTVDAPGPEFGLRAFVLREEQVSYLGAVPGSERSNAYDVSADGLVVVGDFRWSGSYGKPCLWRNGVIEIMSDLEGMATSVSDDGLVITGRYASPQGIQAFRWENGVLTGLGDLIGGDFYSQANAISADGSVVVGHSYGSVGGGQAFRWENNQMIGLGFLSELVPVSSALAVSTEGSVIVGYGYTDMVEGQAVSEAFIWDEVHGMRNLRGVLENDFGLDLIGWTLKSAIGISDDGLAIVGTGINPQGSHEAWIAKIPGQEPMVYYVDSDAPGANDGSSWDDAFTHLQSALIVAESGDEIRVAQGVYTPEDPLLLLRASSPSPADGATVVSITADLSWTAGSDAISHDVYFGTTSPGVFQGNQIATTFDPGTMAYYTTYYWRIDEINNGSKTTGIVWSFMTLSQPPPPPPMADCNDPEYVAAAGDRTVTFQLKNGVVIKGGYAGFGEPEPSERDPYIYQTILSGDIGIPRNSSDNTFHVVTGTGTDETAILDGFTITAGNANENYPSPHANGGGMYNYSGSPTLINCTFIANSASGDGGGMFNDGQSNPTLTGCTFRGNSSIYEGGAISNRTSSPTITNCNFIDNSSNHGGGISSWPGSPVISDSNFSGNSAELGGAVFNFDSDSTLTNCIFSNNYAELWGGAICSTIILPEEQNNSGYPGEETNNENSIPLFADYTFSNNSSGYESNVNNASDNSTITGCTFSGNSAMAGGGVCYIVEGNPSLDNCTFVGNSALIGGGLVNAVSTMTITNCKVSSNSGEYYGGAFYNEAGSATITNCIFSQNTSGFYGGAIHEVMSSSSLHNCLITGNSSNLYGGAMYYWFESSPQMFNCTFAGNSAPVGNAIVCAIPEGGGVVPPSTVIASNCIFWNGGNEIANMDNSIITITYSDVEGGYSGLGNMTADPCFVRPEYFGPIAYWKFDETEGTTAYDSTGSNHGNVYGAHWTTGLVDGALSFDGLNDYVSIPENPKLNNLNAITLQAWIRPRRDAHWHVLDKGDGDKRIYAEGTTLTLDGRVRYTGNHAYARSVSHTLTLNSWQHVALTWSRADNTTRLYHNGVETYYTNRTIGTGDVLDDRNHLWTIGARGALGDVTFFDGLIDEAAIYDRVLSSDEIWQNYLSSLYGLAYPDSVMSDYHLLPGSPCINKGDPLYIAAPDETDLDGKPRIIGSAVDMGAYEFQNTRPVADAGPDQTVEAQAPWGATITLDGSGSSDADSTSGTNDDIADFNWYLLDPCDPNADILLGNGEILDCNIPIGEHIILLEVIDKAAASDTDEVNIIVQDTTPPDINCPQDVILECPSETSPSTTGKATASDTCSDVTIRFRNRIIPGCGNTKTIERTWIATDEYGNSSSCMQVITLVDTMPPVITCPSDVILECPADTSVEANGSATAGDTCGTVTVTHSDQWQPGCGNTGILTRTWTATDECGKSSSCMQVITVVDTTPPQFELSVSPTMLWPPDHKMVEITPSWTVSDKCDASPDVSLAGIVANEGDNTIGDGHTTDDIQIGEDGSIYLRSERSGTGNDRVYTITYQAVDDCGNTTVRSATVSIPHDFKVLARIASRWLWTGPGRIPEDLNGDGFVNLADVARFAGNWTK